MKKIFFALTFLLFGTANAFAPSNESSKPMDYSPYPTFELYHGAECPHCHDEIKWLKEVQKKYPDLKVDMYEVWHDKANADRWQYRLSQLGKGVEGVPTNIIGDQVVVGFDKAKISELLGIDMTTENQEPEKETNAWKKYLSYSWPIMSLALGLVDGFNPCAMWTLFMLISLLLTIDDKKKRWLIGGVFLATSGIIYGAALLAYLFGFKAITAMLASSMIGWMFRVVGAVAVVTGIITLLQARKAGIDCKIRDAKSKKSFHEKLQSILEKQNFWLVLLGIIGLAISVNAIELLCSFAIPTTFTATILSLNLPLYQQLLAVGLYDLMYMLDDVLVFTIAMYTLNLKVFSPKITKIMHYVGGSILLILGILLLINPSLLSLS